jgi:2-amino-4-hydroxy-6-hydroxymethyldihydropteridine diphosphokinase
MYEAKHLVQGQTTALVAIGANLLSALGTPEQAVRAAIAQLETQFDGFAASRLFRCPAFPAGSGPDFVNAAVRFETHLLADAVLARLHNIESTLGRVRGVRWASRVIDLDLIALGDLVQPNVATQNAWRGLTLEQQMVEAPDQLILPHPRMQDRGFVLKPLADVAPDWTHPLLDHTVAQMLSDLPREDTADVVPL